MNLRRAIPQPLLPYWRAYRQRKHATDEVRRAFHSSEGPPILVYQMSKVGSTTVCESLEAAGIGHRVLHVHFLSDDLPAKRRRYIRTTAYPPPPHYDISRSVQKILSSEAGSELNIITLVREPIARLVSSLYQVPALMGADVVGDSGAIEPRRVIDHLEKAIRDDTTFDYVNTWFDREIKKVFGIDVFESPFPKEAGSTVLSEKNVSLLIIRLEDLSRIGSSVITNFLGLAEPIILNYGRRRSDSSARDSYQLVKSSLRLPRDQVERAYESRFVRHFYTEEMIQNFVDRWSAVPMLE